jgi:hypothetical protein
MPEIPVDDPRQHARQRRALAGNHLRRAVGHHCGVLDVSECPDNVAVSSFGPLMDCTVCGAIDADARPNWNDRAPAITSCQPAPAAPK